jgi:hypothetical protein
MYPILAFGAVAVLSLQYFSSAYSQTPGSTNTYIPIGVSSHGESAASHMTYAWFIDAAKGRIIRCGGVALHRPNCLSELIP